MDNGVVRRSFGLGSLNLSSGFGDTWLRKYEDPRVPLPGRLISGNPHPQIAHNSY